MFWKKTTPNDGSGFCPNVIFEDDEFKEDNKALNDQGECERELMLFCLQPLQAQFELFQHHSIGFVNIKKKNVCRHQSKGYFIKCFNLLLYQRKLSQPNSISVGSDLIMGRIPAQPPTETCKALAGNLGSLLSVFNLILTQQEEKDEKNVSTPPLG
jgi:hypothetical protein